MYKPKFLKDIYFRYFFSVKKGKCLFVPHIGFCKQDKASIINYKADNCLVFVRYMLENNLCIDKEISVVSASRESAEQEQAYCRKHFPNANISFVCDSRHIKTAWATAEYVFSSEAIFPIQKKAGQQYIVLGYYSVALKNDYFKPTSDNLYSIFNNRLKFARQTDKITSTSLKYSQIESASYGIDFDKFLPVGRCRSDVLLEKEDVSFVREYFKQLMPDYSFSKIILYPPTHRDYERSEFDIKRSILGFDVDRKRFEKFLADNGLLVVCKLHPAQRKEIVDTVLPTGVVNFTGSNDFGLVELMKASDILMTDYSSAYIDWLLLNKPVVFNFYDLETYEKSRGLSVHPIKRICAGEIFTDEQSFYDAMKKTLANPDCFSEKRAEILEEMITYRTDVCKNTYQIIFEQ